MCRDLGSKEPDVETASNSTYDAEEGLDKMTEVELTKKLFCHVLQHRPVSISAKVPTLDDVRAVIAVDFVAANDLWKGTAPKKVVSRYSLS